jgi:hypothetical protein
VRISGMQDYCPACGFEFARTATPGPRTRAPQTHRHNTRPLVPVASGPVPGWPVTSHSSRSPRAANSGIESWIGLRTVSGVVIAVDTPYLVKHKSSWLGSMLKVLVGVCIVGPALLAVAITSRVWSLLTPWRSQHHHHSFASQALGQFGISYVSTMILRPSDAIPVRDIRIRDADGLEHLVRVRGDLVSGNFGVGDEVEVNGLNRNGTLMFHSGWNWRTRARIVAKIR